MLLVWIDSYAIGRPLVSEKDRTSTERRVFPAEVGQEARCTIIKLNKRVGTRKIYFLLRTNEGQIWLDGE